MVPACGATERYLIKVAHAFLSLSTAHHAISDFMTTTDKQALSSVQSSVLVGPLNLDVSRMRVLVLFESNMRLLAVATNPGGCHPVSSSTERRVNNLRMAPA